MPVQPAKKELDTIYIRVENVDTGVSEPRCLSDCTDKQVREWLSTRSEGYMTEVVVELKRVIRKLGEEELSNAGGIY